MTTTRKNRAKHGQANDRPRDRQHGKDCSRAETDLEHATIGIRLRGLGPDDAQPATPRRSEGSASADS